MNTEKKTKNQKKQNQKHKKLKKIKTEKGFGTRRLSAGRWVNCPPLEWALQTLNLGLSSLKSWKCSKRFKTKRYYELNMVTLSKNNIKILKKEEKLMFLSPSGCDWKWWWTFKNIRINATENSLQFPKSW